MCQKYCSCSAGGCTQPPSLGPLCDPGPSLRAGLAQRPGLRPCCLLHPPLCTHPGTGTAGAHTPSDPHTRAHTCLCTQCTHTQPRPHTPTGKHTKRTRPAPAGARKPLFLTPSVCKRAHTHTPSPSSHAQSCMCVCVCVQVNARCVHGLCSPG